MIFSRGCKCRCVASSPLLLSLYVGDAPVDLNYRVVTDIVYVRAHMHACALFSLEPARVEGRGRRVPTLHGV